MARMRFYVSLLSLAMLLSLTHAVLPHHHHQNLICFNPRCLHECATYHHHGEKHSEEGGELEYDCHYHESDESVYFLSYLINNHKDNILSEISNNSCHLSFAFAHLPLGEVAVASPTETDTSLFQMGAPPSVLRPFAYVEELRGPPYTA